MPKKLIPVIMVAVLLTTGLTAAGCPPPGINIAGSASVQPVSERLAKAYMEKHPGVTIHVGGGGSSLGIKTVADGIIDIGNSSRELMASEIENWPELITHLLCRDGIMVIVHPNQKVANLTTEQIRGIYAGEITDWAQVGGAPGAIAVISREAGSGTRAVFEKMIMGEKKITLGAIFHLSAGMVRTAVAETPLGIGYISYPYLDPSTKALAIDGVAPTMENLKAGTYPLVRPLYKLTMGEPTGLVKDFLDFALSPEGQEIVEQEGFIPIK